jgi:hypothetical protein
MLHAQSITFRTETQDELTIEAPVPPDFLLCVQAVRTQVDSHPGCGNSTGVLQQHLPTSSTHNPGDI